MLYYYFHDTCGPPYVCLFFTISVTNPYELADVFHEMGRHSLLFIPFVFVSKPISRSSTRMWSWILSWVRWPWPVSPITGRSSTWWTCAIGAAARVTLCQACSLSDWSPATSWPVSEPQSSLAETSPPCCYALYPCTRDCVLQQTLLCSLNIYFSIFCMSAKFYTRAMHHFERSTHQLSS